MQSPKLFLLKNDKTVPYEIYDSKRIIMTIFETKVTLTSPREVGSGEASEFKIRNNIKVLNWLKTALNDYIFWKNGLQWLFAGFGLEASSNTSLTKFIIVTERGGGLHGTQRYSERTLQSTKFCRPANNYFYLDCKMK